MVVTLAFCNSSLVYDGPIIGPRRRTSPIPYWGIVFGSGVWHPNMLRWVLAVPNHTSVLTTIETLGCCWKQSRPRPDHLIYTIIYIYICNKIYTYIHTYIYIYIYIWCIHPAKCGSSRRVCILFACLPVPLVHGSSRIQDYTKAVASSARVERAHWYKACTDCQLCVSSNRPNQKATYSMASMCIDMYGDIWWLCIWYQMRRMSNPDRQTMVY